MAEGNPLDTYRQRASFDSQALKLLMLWEEEVVEFERCVSALFRSDPLFSTPLGALSMDEKRRLVVARMKRLFEYNILPDDEAFSCPLKIAILHRLLMAVDGSLLPAFSLTNSVRLPELSLFMCILLCLLC